MALVAAGSLMAAARYRARWALPIDSAPIEFAELAIDEGRILQVRQAPNSPDAIDLGDSVLMPGLVNVHAHIDYTLMRGLLEDLPFFEWIRQLTLRKTAVTEADWIASATVGAAEAVAGGVTTLGDCTDSGYALIGARNLGLRGTIYQEVFAVEESIPLEETITELNQKVVRLISAAKGTRLKVGVSPHAPYTVRPQALREIALYARRLGLPLCIHAAESQAESEWLRHGGGSIGERDTARGIQWMRPAVACTAMEYLDACSALGPDTLVVHGVQIAAADRTIIRDTRCAWAHCPKSNAKLGNGVVPLEILMDCYPLGEARVGLGSDSVASNNTMDLFEEMRFAVLAQRARCRNQNAMTAHQALVMSTLGGARALGMEDEIGTITPGKRADLIAVRLDSLASIPAHDPVSALVYAGSARDVKMTMIDGEVVYQDGEFRTTNLTQYRQRLLAAAARLRDWTPAS